MTIRAAIERSTTELQTHSDAKTHVINCRLLYIKGRHLLAAHTCGISGPPNFLIVFEVVYLPRYKPPHVTIGVTWPFLYNEQLSVVARNIFQVWMGFLEATIQNQFELSQLLHVVTSQETKDSITTVKNGVILLTCRYMGVFSLDKGVYTGSQAESR